MTDFAHARPHLFTDYPRLLAEVAHEYLTVDGVKAEKQRKVIRRLTGLPRRRLLSDIAGALRAFV